MKLTSNTISVWRLCLAAGVLSFLTSAAAGLWIPHHLPRIHDEFSYLLQAETFAKGRLTTPAHPLAPFFEYPHIITEPTYNSKYQPGHSLFIAIGCKLGKPIVGVWVENAVFMASLTWMLAVFLPRRWVIFGAILAIIQFGFFGNWTQTFLSAPLAAAGGALVWGGSIALTRRSPRSGWLVGLGVVFLMFSRPFEGALVCILPAGLLVYHFFVTHQKKDRSNFLMQGLVPASLVALAGAAMLATYNNAVTGDPLKLPYALYEEKYSGAPLFVWQKFQPAPPRAHPSLIAFHEQFVVPMSMRDPLSPRAWFGRMCRTTVHNLGWVLTLLASAGVGHALWRRRQRPWAALAVAAFIIPTAGFLLTPWFDIHYYAAALPPLFLLAIHGVRSTFLPSIARRTPFLLCAALITLAATLSMLGDKHHRRPASYRNGVPEWHNINSSLDQHPGKFLILVHYLPPYNLLATYLWNPPDIDAAKVVWAWDRGEIENQRLLDHYPDRKAIMMQVDNQAISFTGYPSVKQ